MGMAMDMAIATAMARDMGVAIAIAMARVMARLRIWRESLYSHYREGISLSSSSRRESSCSFHTRGYTDITKRIEALLL